MEKKSSFYEFLAANSSLVSKEKEQKPKQHHIMLAWLLLFFINSALLWTCWNYAISFAFKVPNITFLQSLSIYVVAKILSRGFFSVQ